MVTALTLISQRCGHFFHILGLTNIRNNYPLLSLINSPEDLRLLNKEQLPQLFQELRSYLLESVSQTSGHFKVWVLVPLELTVCATLHFQNPFDPINLGCGPSSLST